MSKKVWNDNDVIMLMELQFAILQQVTQIAVSSVVASGGSNPVMIESTEKILACFREQEKRYDAWAASFGGGPL